MAKDQKIGELWKLLFGIVACLSLASPVLSDSSTPTSYKCNKVRLPDGTMLQTVPKHFSPPAAFAGKFPGKQIICRMPDYGKNPCKNSWCEETLEGYNCHCSSGFKGRHCDKLSCSSPPMEDEFQHEYNGSSYHFSTRKMNHSSAFAACSQYGSHLVFIESQKEWSFIIKTLVTSSNEDWIGLISTNGIGARWLDGSRVTFSALYPYPFQHNGLCFVLRTYISDNKYDSDWVDRDCSKQVRFICEKEVGK